MIADGIGWTVGDGVGAFVKVHSSGCHVLPASHVASRRGQLRGKWWDKYRPLVMVPGYAHESIVTQASVAEYAAADVNASTAGGDEGIQAGRRKRGPLPVGSV